MAVSTSNYTALTPAVLKAVPFTQVSIAEAAITSTYQAVGGENFRQPMLLIIIVSTMDDTVQWSWDGVHPAFPIVAGATIIIDMKSDKIVLPASFGPYVKLLGAPTLGSLYVGGFSV